MRLCHTADYLKSLLSSSVLKVFIFHDLTADKNELLTTLIPNLPKQISQLYQRLKRLFALLFVRLQHFDNNVQ